MNTSDIRNALSSLRGQAKWHWDKSRVVKLRPATPPKGNVLISYIVEPFLLRRGQAMPTTHTNYWECVQMANIFLGMGYAVDVINSFNKTFIPRKEYVFWIENRMVLERVAPLLNKDCVKIMHIETAHALFHNAAEAKRLLELQRRRGITLRPRRYMTPNLAIEHADCATILGNEFTMGTYAYARKPLYRIPISAVTLHEWHEKDFEACRRRFLWLNSGGLVHKGLDLVLEAFASMPDHHLTVCGPVDQEDDFARAFHKELYETPNIRTLGWVDVASPEFRNLRGSVSGFVSASCSEGSSGSVIACMHAGLVPIVSYECGVDVRSDVGLTMEHCSVEEIRQAVRSLSSRPAAELRSMARNAWEYARANHTRTKFAEAYAEAIAAIAQFRTKRADAAQTTGIVSPPNLAAARA